MKELKAIYIGERTKQRHTETRNGDYMIGWSHSGDWKQDGDFSTMEIHKDGERVFSFPIENIRQVELINIMIEPIGFTLIDEAPRFRARFGDKYFYISATGVINEEFESECSFDDDLFEAGNYFETYREAVDSKFKEVFEKEMV